MRGGRDSTRRVPALGQFWNRRHSVSHLAVFPVSIPDLVGEHLAAQQRGRDRSPTRALLLLPAALSPAMVVDFPLPAAHEHLADTTEVAISRRQGPGRAQSVVASGQVRLGNVRDCSPSSPRAASVLSPGSKRRSSASRRPLWV